MQLPVEHPKTRILAPLWHSPQAEITAGGFRRTLEVLKRTPEDVEFVVLDNAPSFLSGTELPRVTVRSYRIPRVLRKLEHRWFVFERVVEWILAFFLMAKICVELRLAGERFDLVVAPSSEQVHALAAGVVAKHLFSCRLVACNMNIEIFPAPFRKVVAWLHNRADVVITISGDLERKLRSYGVRAPIEVNGVGLDYPSIAEAIAGLPNEKRFDAVFVGRHDREKGIFDLMEIWERVTEQHPAARLVMIGSCNPVNQGRLDAMIAEKGLTDNVVLAGVVGEQEKLALISASKLCVFPSYIEGWAIVPQECLACGLPVVAYDLLVYAENIKGCESVFTVPEGDWRALAEQALALLSDEGYAQAAKHGPGFVTRFGWDEVAAREFATLRRQL